MAYLRDCQLLYKQKNEVGGDVRLRPLTNFVQASVLILAAENTAFVDFTFAFLPEACGTC